MTLFVTPCGPLKIYIHVLVGSNMPIFGGGRYPAVSLRLRWIDCVCQPLTCCFAFLFSYLQGFCWLFMLTCSLNNQTCAEGLSGNGILKSWNSGSPIAKSHGPRALELEMFCCFFHLNLYLKRWAFRESSMCIWCWDTTNLVCNFSVFLF